MASTENPQPIKYELSPEGASERRIRKIPDGLFERIFADVPAPQFGVDEFGQIVETQHSIHRREAFFNNHPGVDNG